MALTTVSNGGTIAASDINQLVNVLQRPGGSTEVGKYYLEGNGPAAGAVVSNWISSLSRTSSPTSVSIDTADLAPTASANTPSTVGLSSSGFAVQFSVSANTSSARCAGNYTIHY